MNDSMIPTFSVIIPTLNEELFLPRLLSSLVAQTVKNFEVIVVDGLSRDRTVAKAKLFAKKLPRLTVIVSNKASLPIQRNLGASRAHGQWLVFADADSVLVPQFFDRVRDHLRSHRCRVATSWCLPDGYQWWEKLVAFLANLTIEGSVLLHRQFTPGPLTLVEKTVFAALGGYSREYSSFGEDFEFGQRLARAGFRLSIIRQRLYHWSLRRWRAEGVVPALWKYVKIGTRTFISRRPPQQVPGYSMGGHLYR